MDQSSHAVRLEAKPERVRGRKILQGAYPVVDQEGTTPVMVGLRGGRPHLNFRCVRDDGGPERPYRGSNCRGIDG